MYVAKSRWDGYFRHRLSLRYTPYICTIPSRAICIIPLRRYMCLLLLVQNTLRGHMHDSLYVQLCMIVWETHAGFN